MSKGIRHINNRPVILLSALIAALLIMISGLLWMLLSQGSAAAKSESMVQLAQNSTSVSDPVNAASSQDSSLDSVTASVGLSAANSYQSLEPSAEQTESGEAASVQFASSEPEQTASAVGTEAKKKSKVVPKSKAVDSSYLDDAVFIGDSISVSLSLYKALPAKNVIATQNVSLYQVINDKEVFATAKGKVSLKTALKGKDPKKIYVLLGANGMNGWSNKKQIGYYETLLDQLEDWYPDAIIYVESMTPVTASRNKTDKKINNTKIEDYNERLLKLVEERGDHVYYLNIAETLKTKYGNLKAKYDGGDGLHFSPAAAKAVVQYALTHTVKVD